MGGQLGIWLHFPEPAEYRGGLDTAIEMLGESQFGNTPVRGLLDKRLDQSRRVLTRWRTTLTGLMGMKVEMVIAHRSAAVLLDHRLQRTRTHCIRQLIPGGRRDLFVGFEL